MVQPTAMQMVDELLRASRALVGVAARSLADVGDVTLPQYRALVVVGTRPTTTMSDLADALAVHPTTATRLCDRLVDKRLIRRAGADDDRRRTVLRLTSKGERLVQSVTDRRRRHLHEVVSRMEPHDVRAAISALDAFADAAGEPDGSADPFAWDVGAEP